MGYVSFREGSAKNYGGLGLRWGVVMQSDIYIYIILYNQMGC